MQTSTMLMKWWTVGIVLFFIGTCIVPTNVESVAITNENRNESTSSMLNCEITFLFGSVYNLSVDGNYYHIYSHHIREIRIFWNGLRYWIINLAYMSRGDAQFSFYDVHFSGILKPNFVCGVFYKFFKSYNRVTAFPEEKMLLNGNENRNGSTSSMLIYDIHFLFGSVYSLSVDGNTYQAYSHNLREIDISGNILGHRNWHIQLLHLTGDIPWGFDDVHFCGILKPNFVCGVFYKFFIS
jgi:hypothetical protein